MTRHLIAAAWNKAEITERFLESFARETAQPWRLVIVDNGSTDRTPALLESWRSRLPALIVLRNEQNLGCAKAWNRGIRHARAEGATLIGVLNNDLVFGPRWDEGLLAFHGKHADAHPVFGPHTMKCELDRFPARATRFMHRNAARMRAKLGSECMFFVPSVFDRVGYFDERYFVSYEDTDFYVRCIEQGIQPVVTGASVLWHREKTTRGEIGSAHEIEAREQFIAKWGGLGILRQCGWTRNRWVIRYWRHRERLGLL
jgi:GT2 family glycosyltransferase